MNLVYNIFLLTADIPQMMLRDLALDRMHSEEENATHGHDFQLEKAMGMCLELDEHLGEYFYFNTSSYPQSVKIVVHTLKESQRLYLIYRWDAAEAHIVATATIRRGRMLYRHITVTVS